MPTQHHAAQHARFAGAGGGGANGSLGIRRIPKPGQHAQAAILQLGGLGIFVLIDHVFVGALAHQMQRFWLHPGADKGRQIEHGVAIQHQVVVDELVGQIGVQAMLRQLIARQHGIGLAALMQAMAEVGLKVKAGASSLHGERTTGSAPSVVATAPEQRNHS